jgi:hypothetical protein
MTAGLTRAMIAAASAIVAKTGATLVSIMCDTGMKYLKAFDAELPA